MKHRHEKFVRHKWNYIWQPLLAASFVVIALVALGGIGHVELFGFIGTSSLASSAFLVFSIPSGFNASRRSLLGGYFVCSLMGIIFSGCAFYVCHSSTHFNVISVHEVTAAIGMAFAMFLMVLFRFEHPPAAGFALGLVVEPWTKLTLTMLWLVIFILIFIKWITRRWLVDLV